MKNERERKTVTNTGYASNTKTNDECIMKQKQMKHQTHVSYVKNQYE